MNILFNIDLVIFAVTSLATLILGIAVLTRNPKSATNQLFFFLTVSMSVWSGVNTLSYRNANTLILARLVLFAAVVFATFFFLFAITFPKSNLSLSRKHLVAMLTMTLIAMGATLSPFVFKEISAPAGGGIGEPVVGPGIAAFALTVLFYDFGGLAVLVQKVIRSRGVEKRQYSHLFIGLSLMLASIIILNFIFPSALKNTRFIPYGPLLTFPFLAFTSYAIVKHRLLDIRLIVARSVAYVLVIGTLALTYSLGLFGITNVILEDSSSETLNQLLLIGLAGLLALTFQPIKRFFDRVSNKIFFRDAYDSQAVLDQIGDVITAEIDLAKILDSTRNILVTALKSSFIEFVLFKQDRSLHMEAISHHAVHANSQALTEHLHAQKKEVVVTEELPHHSPLRAWLVKQRIALSVRLDTKDETAGFMLFGEKQSGDIYNSQDLKLLSIAAPELAVAIQNALRFEEIQKFNITLQKKIDAATSELKRTNEKLKALDEAKDEFISMASHQLRTPLTAIKGYVSMVMEGDAGKIDPKQKDLLQEAFASSQRMVYLIADLLNVSRLKTGKFVIEPSKVYLPDVISSEIKQLKETAKARKLKLVYEPPAHFPIVWLDDNKIRQVIMNFADNAIYYTPAGGIIRLELTNKKDSIEFRVIDNGIGVPKSEQPKLFSKFYRAGNARKARPDGTGLGLFMARKVVISQGGSVIFHSEEGKGSTFGFSFPKEKIKVPTHIPTKPTAPEAAEQELLTIPGPAVRPEPKS